MHTRGGHVSAIRGAEHAVFSRGHIGPKGVALNDLHENPDRLRTLLIRRNGQPQRSTWDEAFAPIEQRLPAVMQAHGRDAVAVAVGNPAAHKMGLLLYFGRLAKALGTKNEFSARCTMHDAQRPRFRPCRVAS